ncbi:MAG: exodeoxyribonuclease V subunit gamma [Chlamydiae bacterium]|nr:exodeoxyribonuclease V subunit gamma [Chlamydiota bacterium]
MRSYAFFSNRLECLAEGLQKQLVSSRAPFERHFVIVPDGKVKSYLYRYFALESEAKVAFGMEVLTLPEALLELTRSHKKQSPFYFPSQLELSLYIEEKITALHLAREGNSCFSPLWKYLGEENVLITPALRRKIISLSEQLSRFFSLLGMQPEGVILEWLKKDGWQQALWELIYTEGSLFSYPQRVLQGIVPLQEKIHLFGFSYIPKVYFDFFQKTVCYSYLLSPSEYFWEDLYSDKERVFLAKVLEGKKVRLKVREQFDMYLRESNPLLANWGKMGKEFLQRIGQTEPYIEEYYVPSSKNTALARVQEDFFHLGEENEASFPKDNSLQLHACTSKLREVEVLHETLLKLIKHSDKDITPSDILVLSPSLASYIPYIHQVFEKSPLEYRIMDAEEPDKDDLLSAFEYLLSLSEKRFERAAVLELFSYTPFQKRHGWTSEDMYLLSKWADKVSIQWGFNGENRKEILEASLGSLDEVGNIGSWQYGFERLLAGLIFASNEEIDPNDLPFALPEYALEWSESELLGQVIATLEHLARDLKELEHLSAPFSDWMARLEKMATRYFIGDEEGIFTRECAKLKMLLGDSCTPFSLESFSRVFHSISRKRKSSFQGSQLQAVTFTELKIGSVLPSKVIYLLGMEEESFPRKELSLPMCDLGSFKNKSYLPSKAEEDRYLFLEAILSARSHLMISYGRISSQDNKPQNAAAVVEELFTYVEHKYGVTDKTSLIISPALQMAAKSYYGSDKKIRAPFIPEFYGESKNPSEKVETEKVSIKELTRFAKHPIKFFLQDVLGIYLPSLFQRDEPEFILPGYEKAALRSEMLKKSLTQALGISKSKGALPTGLFEEIASKRVKEESDALHGCLKQWGIMKEDVVSFHFSETCKTPVLQGSRWSLPALHIKSPMGTLFTIEGTLPDISDKGLLFYGENKIKDLVSIWPLHLLFLQTKSLAGIEAKTLYMTKKPEALLFDIDNPEDLLGSYLDYFMSCKSQASILMPAWSEWILENNEKEFIKKMDGRSFLDTSPFPDDYLRWIFLRDPSPSAEGLHILQKRIAKKIFEPLFARSKIS